MLVLSIKELRSFFFFLGTKSLEVSRISGAELDVI